MNDLFLGAHIVLEPLYTCHLCCVFSGVTVHVKMWRAAGVSVYTSRRLPANSVDDDECVGFRDRFLRDFEG